MGEVPLVKRDTTLDSRYLFQIGRDHTHTQTKTASECGEGEKRRREDLEEEK